MENNKQILEDKKIAAKYIADTLKILAKDAPNIFLTISSRIAYSDHNLIIYRYTVNETEWIVLDTKSWKLTVNDKNTYHCFFSKIDGFNCRFGATVNDDPEYCGLGPEIADIEIVTGSCPKVNSENCRWCYKNNTSTPGKVMTFEQFKNVIDCFPKNLTQVALGITGVKSNPYLKDILIWLKEQGIIGNLTLTGADLDDEMTDVLCQYCGACAVSCYDKAKDLCYNTINKLYTNAKEKFNRDMHLNMHIVIADFSISHVMDVLNDIKDGKVPGLKSIVMLHAKPVGRAEKLNCNLSKDNLIKVIKFCLDNNISFGFDSCNGYNVQDILIEMNKSELCSSIEPCESARMSIYVNVDGKITPCSFVEHVYEDSAIDLTNKIKLEQIWMQNEMLNSFRNCIKCSKSCPIYKLDCI
jgi:hypothetical protein